MQKKKKNNLLYIYREDLLILKYSVNDVFDLNTGMTLCYSKPGGAGSERSISIVSGF